MTYYIINNSSREQDFAGVLYFKRVSPSSRSTVFSSPTSLYWLGESTLHSVRVKFSGVDVYGDVVGLRGLQVGGGCCRAVGGLAL